MEEIGETRSKEPCGGAAEFKRGRLPVMQKQLTIGRHGVAKERVAKGGTSLELLVSSEGIEVIRQTVQAGRHFYLRSEEDWAGFELLYVLGGRLLHGSSSVGQTLLERGDFLYHNGLAEKEFFRAQTEVHLLVFSTSPSFHLGESEIQDMLSIAKSVEEKDSVTEGHCKRLEQLAVLTGERFGLSGQELIDLSYGAFLHDIGKVQVRSEILEKRGALDDAEWAEMRKHPEYGAEMLKEKVLLHGAAEIVRAHHEHYDGGGYPRGLKGEEIPIGARVVAVVDAYDAMTSVRPYQRAQAKQEAIEELRRNAGTHFDPNVVRVFIEVASEQDVTKGIGDDPEERSGE
jgi:HD-GYP domain-containing protein (c-di-GMP phosphodiesterase class II)